MKDMEAETINGISLQKIYFQPDVDLSLAISQIQAGTNYISGVLPAGTHAPLVVRYSASAVPVLQIALSSARLSEARTSRPSSASRTSLISRSVAR
jgi:multidrug efflux pump subunit AcrB